jgi:hypothetical protein
MKKIKSLLCVLSMFCLFPTYASASESLTFFNTEQDIKLLGRYTEPVKLTVSIQSDSSSDSCETIGWYILDMLPQKPVPLTALESWISPLRNKIRCYLYPEGAESEKRGSAFIKLTIANTDDSDPIWSLLGIEAKY